MAASLPTTGSKTTASITPAKKALRIGDLRIGFSG